MQEQDVTIISNMTILGVCLVMGMCGITANIINITIFIKTGFTESINVSLLGLAVSDLLYLIFIIPWGVFLSLYLLNSHNMQWSALGFTLLYLVIPLLTLSRVTCLITVYITVERCLCFVIPLRVKRLLTPTRSAFVVVTIFLLELLTLVLPYLSLRLDWRWNSSLNRSIIDVVGSRRDSAELMRTRTEISVSSKMISLLALAVSNIALAISVNKQAKWRARIAVTASQRNPTAASSRPTDATTYRNRKLARMIQFLSLILFSTYLPSTLLDHIDLVLPEFSFNGQYKNEFRSFWMLAFVAQTLNSSVNIIFYYRMNTRFRNTFRKMFRKGAARVGIFPADSNTMDNTVAARTQISHC
ncbi:chemosensory receptor A [Elysia marginata]|uniref:Chemosensory receptor A n=1 Tax=Elysia marginata TaxID=1093978 RepID=A0AAV4EWK2_9GAST|nr:chemosensory receptor A [Elysia marginata]